MEVIILVLKSLLVANLIVNFQPISWILELLPSGIIKWILIVLTGCFKCCSTWTTLIITGDLYLAAGAFIVAELITKINNKIWEKKKINL